MDSPVTARAALLQALREGPGYGLALIRRVRQATGGQVRVSQGSAYPALKALQRERLVRAWTVVPGRRRGGRGRRYYELTVKGVRVSETAREALRGLADRPFRPTGPPATESAALVRARLDRLEEVSSFVRTAREALRVASEGRR